MTKARVARRSLSRIPHNHCVRVNLGFLPAGWMDRDGGCVRQVAYEARPSLEYSVQPRPHEQRKNRTRV